MSSDRKIAASRRNGCKSRGPRSAAGKTIASRNALKHGLAAIAHRQEADKGEIERIAKALCGPDENPALLEAARAVAANILTMRAIAIQKIAAVERLREPTSIAMVKGDNSLELARAKFLEAWLVHREIVEEVPRLLEKYNDRIPSPADTDCDGMVPICIKALLEESESSDDRRKALEVARKQMCERNEFELIEEATPDLLRLDRYERRAWSRHKRALRAFMHIKITRGMSGAEITP